MEPCLETEPKDVPSGRAVDRQLGRHLCGHRQISLSAELEQLELHRDLVAVLLTRPQTQPSQGIRRHELRVAACRALTGMTQM